MSGMGSPFNADNPTIVSAFHSALAHQFLIVLVILVFVGAFWNGLRAMMLRSTASARAGAGTGSGAGTGAGSGTSTAPTTGAAKAAVASLFTGPEPVARRLLRISFGFIWLLDGLLQAQSAMPLGMPTQVVQPAAASSPTWVQHLVNVMVKVWSYHPIAVPAGTVWVQIGLGIWLLASSRGRWSRLGGLASAAWGLFVWIFGEAFGGIFAPGLTWLFGAPGAVLFYCFAGVLVALPERAWATRSLGRIVLSVMGLFFVGMAVLQAWPGRGFWQGRVRGHPLGSLTTMTSQMAQTPQPRFLATWVSDFSSFDGAHGWAVNLFAVVILVTLGLAFLSGRPKLARYAVIFGAVICLADWIFIEDFGFFGGVGTDPNSMIPMALIFIAGYVALTKLPPTTIKAEAAAEAARPMAAPPPPSVKWRERVAADPTYAFRSVAAIGAIMIILIGAAPMAIAAMNPNADPILQQAVDGTPDVTNFPAPAFSLVDENGKAVSLASLHGKTLAVTFLDPVCTSDCPVIAQEFRVADSMLGGESRDVEMIAVNANPRYVSTAYLVAFDRQENLETMPNWVYLTGSLKQLQKVWNDYGVLVAYGTGGSMIAHTETTYVIDRAGHTRFVIDTDPGPATSATQSSFSVTLANALKSAIASS